MSLASVTHCAEVIRIEEDAVVVSIAQRSACAHCQAARFCSSMDSQEREVSVPIHMLKDTHFRVGDKVRLEAHESSAWKAIAWALLIPIILLVASVTAADRVFALPEWQTALVVCAVFVLYGGILYLVRNKLKQQFQYTLTPDYTT